MTTQQPHSTQSDENDDRFSTRFRNALTNTASQVTIAGILVLIIASTPVAAQELGSVFCDTDVEIVINTFFSAMLGLGLPISLFYTAYSGFRYMRAGGNPEAEREAKQKLYYGVMGLLIILGVLVLPEIADNIFGTVGAGFSDCVKPF